MASLWPSVDICPHHKAPRLAWSVRLAVPSLAESSPGTAGVAGALARGGGAHTRALPTQRLAPLNSTIPSLRYLGLVGLSLQLKLKHESSPGYCSLCAAFEGGPCQKHVTEIVSGLLRPRDLCSSQGSISSAWQLVFAAAKST